MWKKFIDWIKRYFPHKKIHIDDVDHRHVRDKKDNYHVDEVVHAIVGFDPETGDFFRLGTWDQLQTMIGGICIPGGARLTFRTCGGDLFVSSPNVNTLQFNAGLTIPLWFDDTVLVTSVPVVINEPGRDLDTRVEGLSDTNLLFVDASTDRVGIGLNNPAEKLEVAGNVRCTDLITTDDVIVGDDLLLGLGSYCVFDNDGDTRIYATVGNQLRIRSGQIMYFMIGGTDWFNLNITGFYANRSMHIPGAYSLFLNGTYGTPGNCRIHIVDVGGKDHVVVHDEDNNQFDLTVSRYGSFYGNNIAWTSVAFGGGGTFVIISDANITGGEVSNTAFQNNQELLIGMAGRYAVTWDISAEIAGVNKHIEAGLGINGAIQLAGRNHAETKLANTEEGFGGNAILNLAAADTLSVMLTNVDDNTQVEVHHINLTAIWQGN